ncbi:MAG: hypothetical protein IIA88_09115, partial [Bacteroidetes bacterium]|nr:hypothetical protein [Bacteroidota bacterium]
MDIKLFFDNIVKLSKNKPMKNTTLNLIPHPLKTVLFALLMAIAATTANAQNWYEVQKIV